MIPPFLIPWLPAVYRWLAIAAVGAALFGFGWIKASHRYELKIQAMVGKAATEGARITAARRKVTERVVLKFAPMLAKQEVITETIIKEVPVYVPASDPPLSAGFRVLHDAAALGLQLPGPAAVRDAAAVPAQDAAGTIAENYGACRKDQLKLQQLQEWAREQQKVK